MIDLATRVEHHLEPHTTTMCFRGYWVYSAMRRGLYTDGLRQEGVDSGLRCILFANRAQVELNLGVCPPARGQGFGDQGFGGVSLCA